MALVGFSGSGKSTLIQCIAKMFDYSSGSVYLDDREVKDMEKAEIIQHIGYISQHPFIFSGTIRENLLYAHQAAEEIHLSADETYKPPDLDYLILALQQAGIFVDVIRFGLNSFLDLRESEMIDKVVKIREQFRKDYGETLSQHIEFYRKDRYLYFAEVAENIIFGSPVGKTLQQASLGEKPLFRSFLDKTGLTDDLLKLGIDLAQLAVDLPVESDETTQFFVAISISPDHLDRYRRILVRLVDSHPLDLSSDDQSSLLSLALQFSPGHQKLMSIPPELEDKIMWSRLAWRKWSEKSCPEPFTYFEEDEYIAGQSILNNILLGRMKTERSQAQETINQIIIRLLIEEDCLEAIAEAGMEYHLGSMGNLLSGGQKQKLAIARVLLKDPKIVLMDESTSALDNKSQSRIQHLIDRQWRNRRTVIAVVHRLDNIGNFDKIGVMKDGKMMEFGSYDELMDKKSLLYELVQISG